MPRSAKTHPSYIHVRIVPTPALPDDVRLLDLMRDVHALVARRLGDSADVRSNCAIDMSREPKP